MIPLDDKLKYVTVSIPKGVADRIDFYVSSLGYWPSRSSFVREAVLEKFDRESQKIVQMRTVAEYDRSREKEEEKDAIRKVAEHG
jgi:Arc/MetJ-type ribon-helix-helix transcriptional regulator